MAPPSPAFRARRKLASPAQLLAELLQAARELWMMHEGDERSAHLAARAGGDLGRDLPLRFSHRFGSQSWKSRLHRPYYLPCVVADLLLGIHFAIAAFIVGGLVLVWAGAALGWRWVGNAWCRYLHLAAIAVVPADALLGGAR